MSALQRGSAFAIFLLSLIFANLGCDTPQLPGETESTSSSAQDSSADESVTPSDAESRVDNQARPAQQGRTGSTERREVAVARAERRPATDRPPAARGLAGVTHASLLAVTPDNSRLVVYARRGGTNSNPKAELLQVWDLTANELVAKLQNPVGHVHDLAISPDGEKLAVYCGNDNDTLHVYHIASNERTDLTIPSPNGYCDLAGFTSDSIALTYAALRSQIPETFAVVDLQGNKIAERPAEDYFAFAAYSPRDELFVMRYPEHTIEVLDMRDLKPKRQPHASASRFSVSPNGQYAVTSDEGMVRVVSLADGSVVHEMSRTNDVGGSRGIYGMAVSPNGQFVAVKSSAGGRGQPPEIWNLRAKSIASLDFRSYEFVFLPDGALAIASSEKGVSFYDPATGQPVSPPFKLVEVATAEPTL